VFDLSPGRYSQNFLRKILNFFVNLTEIFQTLSVLSKQISVKVDVIYYKSNKISIFLCLIGSKIHVKVTKILRNCLKKFSLGCLIDTNQAYWFFFVYCLVNTFIFNRSNATSAYNLSKFNEDEKGSAAR
jgi:hypothetical protein